MRQQNDLERILFLFIWSLITACKIQILTQTPIQSSRPPVLPRSSDELCSTDQALHDGLSSASENSETTEIDEAEKYPFLCASS